MNFNKITEETNTQKYDIIIKYEWVCNGSKILMMQQTNIEAHIQESKQEEHIEDNMSEQSIVSMWRQFQESVNTYWSRLIGIVSQHV